VSDSFEITYAAHTSSCTFLLDGEGICRRIVLTSSRRSPSSSKRDAGRSAARCVGAQYVASLDPSIAGMLTDLPRVGAAMLFARVDERGRVSLVRTGVVTLFEKHRAEDPFVETEKLPSTSVETSAPMLAPQATERPERRVATTRHSRPAASEQDPYDDDGSIQRTQPVQALSPAALRILRGPAIDPTAGLDDEDETLDRTSEYETTTGSAKRPSGSDLGPPAPAKLREAARSPLTGRSEPQVMRPRDEREARTADRAPSPARPPYTERVAGRGRGDR
jgi:hypothetical protein